MGVSKERLTTLRSQNTKPTAHSTEVIMTLNLKSGYVGIEYALVFVRLRSFATIYQIVVQQVPRIPELRPIMPCVPSTDTAHTRMLAKYGSPLSG